METQSSIVWCRVGTERSHLWGSIVDGRQYSWCGSKKNVDADHLVRMPLATAGKCKLCRKSLRRMVRISEEASLPFIVEDMDDEINE